MGLDDLSYKQMQMLLIIILLISRLFCLVHGSWLKAYGWGPGLGCRGGGHVVGPLFVLIRLLRANIEASRFEYMEIAKVRCDKMSKTRLSKASLTFASDRHAEK